MPRDPLERSKVLSKAVMTNTPLCTPFLITGRSNLASALRGHTEVGSKPERNTDRGSLGPIAKQ